MRDGVPMSPMQMPTVGTFERSTPASVSLFGGVHLLAAMLIALKTGDGQIGALVRAAMHELGILGALYQRVRTNTGQTPIRVAGDPNVPTTLINSYGSPTAFLAPRVIRFNVTYSFNRR